MKGKQVGYVLSALIIIGILGIGVRLISTDSNDFNMSGLLPITSDVIDTVKINSNNSDADVSLKKMNEASWMVGKNMIFPPTLENFWMSVSNIKNAQLVSRKAKYHNRFGVSNESGTTVTFYLGQSVQEEFIVGDTWDPDVRLCYIRKSGKDNVYGIPCSQPPDRTFSTNPNLWRNPIIVSIPSSEIDSLEFEFNNTIDNFSITKEINNDWIINNSDVADTRIVDSMLEIFSQFYTSGFANTAVSFDSPDASIRINTIQGSDYVTTKIKFLSKDSESYYVQIPSQPGTTFIVASELIDNYLLLNQEDLKIQSN
tara:strand:- start:3242 stop:4180 length:939 start_codon:yes stop_codon:yes gene_type:complete